VIERYLYDAYGKRTVLDANWSSDADSVSDVLNRQGHHGGLIDRVIDYHVNFRNRILDVEQMRWTQQDPLSYIDGMNVYEHIMSNPLLATDAFGLSVRACTGYRESDATTYAKGGFLGLEIDIRKSTFTEVRTCVNDCGCGRFATSVERIENIEGSLRLRSPSIVFPVLGVPVTVRAFIQGKVGGQFKVAFGGCSDSPVSVSGCSFESIGIGVEGCAGKGLEVCLVGEYTWKAEQCIPGGSKSCEGYRLSAKACVNVFSWLKKCKELTILQYDNCTTAS